MTDDAGEPSQPARPDPAEPSPSGFRVLLDAARPRGGRDQVIVALLCALLGFALVTQVHSTANAGLATERQSDLVDILDSLSARSDQLRAQIGSEQDSLAKLTGGTDQTQAALQEAQQRLATLEILAGTAAASGPGIELKIADPSHHVSADVVLETVEELRDAGAEAMQISGGGTGQPGPSVRVVASSYFVDAPSSVGIVVDGVAMQPPYDIEAIGDPPTMTTAMGIPGGVLDILTGKGASGTVTQHGVLAVTALHQVSAPQYARPAPASASPGE